MNLSNLPAVRLASGVEPQQKWPAMSENDASSSSKPNTNDGIKLIELNPTHGNEGTIVTVVVQALPPHIPAKLAFNSLMVDTKQLQAQGITSLVATVPSFQQTHSPSPNVPISICFLDKDMVTETWIVADFVYDLQQPNDENNKYNKDSATTNSATQSYQPVKYDNHNNPGTAGPSTATEPFQSKANNDFLNSSAAAYQNFYSSPAVNPPYGFGTQIPSYQQYAYQQQPHRDIFVDKYAQQGRPQQQQTAPPPTQYNGYNNSALHLFPSASAGGFTGMLAGGLDQPAAAAAAHNAATASAPTTPAADNTTMIPPMTPTFAHHHQQQPHSLPSVPPHQHHQHHQQQTSSQPPHLSHQQHTQPSSSPAASTTTATTASNRRHNNAGGGGAIFGFKSTTHTPTTSVANYQPYPGLVSRANLDIMGDLDSMTKSWNNDEWDHRRRLVQFWREQHGNKITTSFQPVPQGERASNSGNIVVSCIYWMERNDFFITSVDCIYLLECLMDIRFSVEEKNRIRRNLEGFRPLTVSKCKPDSADFFKLIMSFPNPKPRNIEKDVKVFPWKTLPYALKKIVTKYTASSYNSVPPPPLTPTAIQQQQASSNSMKSSVVGTPTSLLPPATSTTTTAPTSINTATTEHPSTSAVTTPATTTGTAQGNSATTDPFYAQQHHSTYQAQPYSQELYGTPYYQQQQQQDPSHPSNSTSAADNNASSYDNSANETSNANTMSSTTAQSHPAVSEEPSTHAVMEASNMHHSSGHDLPSIKHDLNLAPLMSNNDSPHPHYPSHSEPTN